MNHKTTYPRLVINCETETEKFIVKLWLISTQLYNKQHFQRFQVQPMTNTINCIGEDDIWIDPNTNKTESTICKNKNAYEKP